MLQYVEELRTKTKLRFRRVHLFEPKFEFCLEVGPYRVRTAKSPEDLIESFKLRHEVFHREFRGVQKPGLDFDKFDYFFDHLIIELRETEKIIGTYRLNLLQFQKRSYTALEFDLNPLLKIKGPYLELGRACIEKNFRKGATLSLLWRGIAEYMKVSGANILFGCSSLKLSEGRDAALVHSWLEQQGSVSSEVFCPTRKDYFMPDFAPWKRRFSLGLNEFQRSEAEQMIPSLLSSYLKMGAKICGDPAFDKAFNCIDLLTYLRKEDLVQAAASRFRLE